MRDREPDESGLRLGADAGGTLVTDLAAGSGRSARERRDGGRVVVGLHLHEDVDGFGVRAVDARRGVREPALAGAALDHRRIVAIGAQDTLRCASMGVADHGEQRLRLALAIDDPVRVEDLVAAVLGIGLREHHQLDIGRIPVELAVGGEQVVDLVGRQGKTEFGIGADQSLTTGGQRYATQRPCGLSGEEGLRLLRRGQHRLGHSVVQQCGHGGDLRQRGTACVVSSAVAAAIRLTQPVLDATLDAPHRRETADLCDVGGLARPGRDGAGARYDPQGDALAARSARLSGARLARPIGQQRIEAHALLGGEVAVEVDEVDECRLERRDAGERHPQALEELGDPEG